MHIKGRFITFEGTEGAGKSTHITRIAARLKALGHTVVCLREPGGTSIGESIRKLLKDPSHLHTMCPETELFLFAASRAQLVRQIIQPALAVGSIVMRCDRFVDSTFVYQGIGRGLSEALIQTVTQAAIGTLKPDRTFILDIPADVGLQRAQSRSNKGADRLEQEPAAFYEAVRAGYRALAYKCPHRYCIVDATHSIETLETTIWNELIQTIA